jgi:hypothetical protein
MLSQNSVTVKFHLHILSEFTQRMAYHDFGLLVVIYCILMVLPFEASTFNAQSVIHLSDVGLEFSPFDEQISLLLEKNSDSISTCAQVCLMTASCRIFNFEPQMRSCRLYEGEMDGTGSLVNSATSQSICGSIELMIQDFTNYGGACSLCEHDRFLTCLNSTCQCQAHTYFNGSVCPSQKMGGGNCTSNIQCRNDLYLACQSNLQCGCKYEHSLIP